MTPLLVHMSKLVMAALRRGDNHAVEDALEALDAWIEVGAAVDKLLELDLENDGATAEWADLQKILGQLRKEIGSDATS